MFRRSGAAPLPAAFWWLWGGVLGSALATFVFPFLALFLTARGFGPAGAGAVVACLGGGILLACPLAGAVTDAVGRKPTLVTALVGAAGAAAALALLRAPAAVAVAAAAFGFFTAAVHTPIDALVGDLVPVADRPRAFGLLYWARNSGFGLSGVVGGLLAARGWALPFLLDAATTLGCALVVVARVPETRGVALAQAAEAGAPALGEGWGALRRDRRFLALLALHGLFLVAFLQFQAALPVAMIRRGLTPGQFGRVLAVNALVIMLLQPGVARWASGRRPATPLALGALLVGAGYGAYALCTSVLHHALATAVWSLGEICFLPGASAAASALAPPALRGRYAGAMGVAFGAASLLAPLAGTALLQAAGARALWLACLGTCGAVAAGVLLLWNRGS